MKNNVRDTAKDNIIAKQIEYIITNMNKNGEKNKIDNKTIIFLF